MDKHAKKESFQVGNFTLLNLTEGNQIYLLSALGRRDMSHYDVAGTYSAIRQVGDTQDKLHISGLGSHRHYPTRIVIMAGHTLEAELLEIMNFLSNDTYRFTLDELYFAIIDNNLPEEERGKDIYHFNRRSGELKKLGEES